jgi:integrase
MRGQVQDMWYADDGKRKVRCEQGRRWQARWKAPDGKWRTAMFVKKSDAERHAAAQSVDVSRGQYVDSKAARTLLGPYGAAFIASADVDPSTRETMATRWRVSIEPHLGKAEIGGISPTTVRQWRGKLQRDGLGETTIRNAYGLLSQVLSSAVEDGLTPRNPAQSRTARPAKRTAAKRPPILTHEQVAALVATMPERWAPLVRLAEGTGLRPGEVFGLAVEDIDFLRGLVHVRAQVKIVGSRLVFGDPKYPRSVRTVPVPRDVIDVLAAHLARYPAREVTLPWEEPSGQNVTRPLVFTSREGGAVNRNYFGSKVWRPAARAVDIPDTFTQHDLRHYYASVLIEGGMSPVAVADLLGHSDPGFTMRVYAGLWPDTKDRARSVVEAVLRARRNVVGTPPVVEDRSRRSGAQ